MEGECFAFLCSLQGALVDIFLLRKGKFLFFVVKMFVLCAAWCRCDQRLMIPENALVIKIKIIVADILHLVALSKGVVKSRIQMIIYAADFDDIPGVAVFDPLIRIVSADCDDAPDTKLIEKDFDRLGDSLTDTHSLSEWSYDLVRIWFLEFIVADVFANKIVDIFFLFPFGQVFGRPHELVYPCGHCLLVFFDLTFFEEIFRDKDDIR